MMKLDVLAIGAHPDDIELSCGGTVAKLVKQGRAVGILDLTRGELGTRGSPALRAREAAEAARILGVKWRKNLGLPDGNIEVVKRNILKLIAVLRAFQPRILLIPHSSERHPDHEHTHRLSKEAWYYSGLSRITTNFGGRKQQPFRPAFYLEYLQVHPFTPSIIVDISDVYETRVAAIKAFKSQFHDPGGGWNSKDRETFLSRPQFLDFLETRAKYFGHQIGVRYGEAFYSAKPIGIGDLFDIRVMVG